MMLWRLCIGCNSHPLLICMLFTQMQYQRKHRVFFSYYNVVLHLNVCRVNVLPRLQRKHNEIYRGAHSRLIWLGFSIDAPLCELFVRQLQGHCFCRSIIIFLLFIFESLLLRIETISEQVISTSNSIAYSKICLGILLQCILTELLRQVQMIKNVSIPSWK